MNKLIGYSTAFGMACLLSACGSSKNDRDDEVEVEPEIAMFEVTATNLTLAQPLSPLAAIIHSSDASLMTIGEAASSGLELLAESGDNSELLDSIEGAAEASGAGVIGPGASETVTLELDVEMLPSMVLSVVTMLVNTNDAITAIDGVDISELSVGDTMTLTTIAYDSGTEANTETAATIPGPAGGGEGFNAARDDVRDQVTAHTGVVTADDGLTNSDLNQQHRWDNPVARISIMRVE